MWHEIFGRVLEIESEDTFFFGHIKADLFVPESNMFWEYCHLTPVALLSASRNYNCHRQCDLGWPYYLH